MPKRSELEKNTRGLVVALALATAGITDALAQELAPLPPKQRGGFFVPMLTVAEAYDDNLFFTQFPEGDLVTRLNVGLQTGYRSTRFTVDAIGSRAGDRFREHPEFNTNRARSIAQVSMHAQPTGSIALSLFACYLDTQTPSELNVGSGLTVGRSLATRTSGAPMVEVRLGSLSTMTAAFPVAHDVLDGRISDTMTAIAGFDRRVSRRDTVSLRYEHRWYDFHGVGKAEKSVADVATLGWLGEVSERTILLLRAGPRYAKGAWSAEVLATMKRRLNRGLLTLTYSKGQTTTIGKTGVLDTQSLSATYANRVSRNVEIASGPGLYRNALRGETLTSMRLNVESLWHFAPWFHLGATYSFDLQQPDFGVPGKIRRSSFMVSVLASKDQRRPEEPLSEFPAPEAR